MLIEILSTGPFLDYRFSATQRGRSKLLHRGYGYVRTSRTARNWICDKRNYNCQITCVLDNQRGLFVNGRHNHDPVHRFPRNKGIAQRHMKRSSAPSGTEYINFLTNLKKEPVDIDEFDPVSFSDGFQKS